MIVIGLDILLATLLAAALWMGWRLNGKLKALRASQLDFAKAVMELDAAAARAETGLGALKAAAEEAHDGLLARIDPARSLATRLEKAEGSCDAAARRAEAAAVDLKTAAPPAATLSETIRPLRPIREALSKVEDGEPATRATPRRRHLADEQLFADEDSPVRPSLQGLMRLSLARRGA